MRAVDNDAGVDAGILEGFLGQHHAHGIKVRTSAASAEHQVAVAIAFGLDDGALAVFIDTQEVVALAAGFNGVNRAVQKAVGAVLKTDRSGQTARHFSVGLAFGCARTDGIPADEFAQVLRTERVLRSQQPDPSH